MAQRGRKMNRKDNHLAFLGAFQRRECSRLGPASTGATLPVATPGPGPVPGPSEEEVTMASSSQGGASWTPRPLSDLKISRIYNRSATEAPAELFRKDLISAMRLPDSEPLSSNEYWIITDQWKQKWESGVQVPVNPDSLPEPTVSRTQPVASEHAKGTSECKLPEKYVRIARDDHHDTEEHHLSTTSTRAEKPCAYDLDDTDFAWLELLNRERAQAGQSAISEDQLERVLEELESDKHENLKDITTHQLEIDPDAIIYIHNYWKLKRRAGHNKPLLAPRCGELTSAGAHAQGEAADKEKMRTLVQTRQDLERVRNSCHMVNRREKLRRSSLRLREQTFDKK